MSALSVAFGRAFDQLRRLLGSPVIYAIPWQSPSGATYDADVDAWLDDSTGAVVTKTPAQLTSTEIAALWGADAENLVLSMGGIVPTGDMIAITKTADYSNLDGAMMVVTGSLTGDKYNLVKLENAPDGGQAIFAVATLQRKEQ